MSEVPGGPATGLRKWLLAGSVLTAALKQTGIQVFTVECFWQKISNHSDPHCTVKFVALNTAVVVVAQAHNPTILHPFFLEAQKIVPADWKLEAPPICTPAISIVKYTNGVVFTIEPTKMMIRDDCPKPISVVQDIALNYVQVLPHVRYSAVGINFAGYIECEVPEEWMQERFLKRGPGNDERLKPSAVGIQFKYQVPGGALNLSCDAGTRQAPGEKVSTPCLLVSANYHIPIPEASVEDVGKTINSFSDRLAHFTETVDIIFGLGHSL